MTRLFGQRAIERAAVILRVGQRYSGDELDAALKAARRAIPCSLEEAGVDADAGRSLVEALDAEVANSGRSIQCVPSRITAAFAVFCILTFVPSPGFALDGSTPNAPTKISSKSFTSAEQALRAGIDDLKAGDAASSVAALTYAAEGGQPIARWKLGEMYADGVGVARDDLKAYHYFNQLVEEYDEDAPDQRIRGAISNAFVAVGVYSLTGIPNSDVHADPDRARELFQYAATTFGDPDAEYNLAHMYIVGAGGLSKDNITAARWLMLAAGKGHRPSQVLLGHMLFTGAKACRCSAGGG